MSGVTWESALPDMLNTLAFITLAFVLAGYALFFFGTRRRTEAALRESEARFRDFTELTSDWYWEQDAEFRFRDMSEGAISPKDRIGKTRWELPIKSMTEADWLAHRQTLERHESFRNLVYQVEVQPGNLLWFSISGKPFFDNNGKFLGYRGTGTDITGRKLAEQALQENATQLRLIYDTANAAIFNVDTQGVITHANQRMTEMFACPMEKLIGSEYVAHIHPSERETGRQKMLALLASDIQLVNHERHYMRDDGSQFWGHLTGRRLHDADGKLAGLVGVIADLTVRKQAEEEIGALLAEQKILLDNALVGIAFLKNRVIVRCNRHFAEMLGYTPEALQGQSTRLVHISEEIYQRYGVESYAQVGRTGKVFTDAELQRQDGSIFPCNYSLGALNPNDLDQGVVWVVQDISERKRAEDALHELNDTLEQRVAERTRELEAFSYSVAHDLRGPLRAIDGFSQIVLSDNADKLDSLSISHLQRVRAAAQRLGELIDDLLELALVSRSDLNKQPVDLAQMAREVMAALQGAQVDRDILFSASKTLPTQADHFLARILLDNLLSNAWKYTGKALAARIEFGSFEQNGESVYFVRDNGVGFDMAYAEKLFKPFQRLHHRDDFEGTGIGLSIVHRIVTRHEGKVWVESKEGEGTTFFFTLG